MRLLKVSTAATVLVGPICDSTDGSAETGLGTQNGRIVKIGAGAAFTPDSWAHDGGGCYLVGLSDSHTDTAGPMELSWGIAGTLPFKETFLVIDATVYDALVKSVGYLPVDVTEWLGVAPLALSSQRVGCEVGAYASAGVTPPTVGDYSTARAAKLDNLDAAVTTRAAAATALSTADYSAARATKLDQLDAAVSSRAAAATALSTADYSSARAAKLDYLDVAVSGRAAAATALTNATWTDAKAGYIDAAISSRSAPATGANTVTLQARTAGSLAIPGAVLSVYNSTNTVLITRVTCDASGNATLAQDDGTLKVRALLAGYSFATPQTVTVSGDTTTTITGTAVGGTADSPSNCLVYGTLSNGAADASKTVTFTLSTPAVVDGNQLTRTPITATTDASGYFSFNAPRTATGVLKSPDASLNDTYTVPDAASQDVATWTPD